MVEDSSLPRQFLFSHNSQQLGWFLKHQFVMLRGAKQHSDQWSVRLRREMSAGSTESWQRKEGKKSPDSVLPVMLLTGLEIHSPFQIASNLCFESENHRTISHLPCALLPRTGSCEFLIQLSLSGSTLV